MKLLLDENLPVKLKLSFSDNHEVITVREMGWTGKKNGELLKIMNSEKFYALVSIDKNLRFQQNTTQLDLKIFILSAPDNKILTLKPYVKKLETVLLSQIKESIVEIKI